MNETERNRLVEENIAIVGHCAASIASRLPLCVDLDDLQSAGTLGLIDAASRYDELTGTPFGAFARHRVRGAILDYLRSVDYLTRDQRRIQKDIQACSDGMYTTSGERPDTPEIASCLQISEERVNRSLQTTVAVVSASVRPNDAEDGFIEPQIISPEEDRPDVMFESRELAETLREVMDSNLNPRYQMVVELYYAGEMTMKEIGQAIGVNESRVSQIHKSALQKMRSAFADVGVRDSSAFLHA